MTRDEAIKRIKAWNLDSDDREILAVIIPELKESEDERIRKEINILYSDIDACITELLKARTDKDSESEGKALFKMEGLMVATLQDLSCIEDYLEKQKESENTSASTMAPSCWQKEQKSKAKAKSPLSPHELYDAKIEGISQGRQDVLDHPEQFGLQKPAEWSEDYREEDIQTRFAFYTYKDEDGVLYLSNVFVEETSRNHGFGTKILIAAEKVAETIGATTISLKVKQDSPANAWYRKNGYGYVAFEDGYDWLEKNLEYMKPNKQEWSEEDEKTFWGLTAYIPDEELERLGVTRLDILKKFKSLRPQPKQEWTEEDEHRRTDAIYFLESAKSHYADTSEIEKTILWLKSSYLNLKKHNEDVAKLCSNEWSEEDEKIAKEIEEELWYPGDFPDYLSKEESELYDDCQRRLDWFKKHIKSLRPQSKDEIYKEKDEAFKLGKHQLAIEFMNYLDENRPEGKMSLSNAECEDIDKAFKENDWERIMRYVNKYAWKPSKEQVEALEDTMAYIPEFFKPKSNLASLLRDLKKQV